MNVQIQSVKFDADKKLIDFIEAKLSKIDRFSDEILGAEVFLKLDKDNENGNKVATLKIAIPGNDLVAERRAHSFEEAVESCYEAIKRQIAKHKEK